MPELSAAARTIAPRRGRRPSVERERVVEVALALVDRDGLAALTMRDLARELGVAVATVYSCAGSKEEILQSVADLVLGDLPEVDVSGQDWRSALATMFRAVHRRLVAHPAIAQLSVLEPLVGPGKSASHDALFAILTDAGLDDVAAVRLWTTLSSYTIGYTLYQVSRTARPEAPSGRLGLELSDSGFDEGLAQIIGAIPD